MGGDLVKNVKGGAPSFLIQAMRDPRGANLDRVQVVKGWVGIDGAPREQIYDVAWSGERQLLEHKLERSRLRSNSRCVLLRQSYRDSHASMDGL